MNNAVTPSGIRLELRKLFLKSEPARGYTLLSPTLLAMIFGLAMATILVLLVIPALIAIQLDIHNLLTRFQASRMSFA